MVHLKGNFLFEMKLTLVDMVMLLLEFGKLENENLVGLVVLVGWIALAAWVDNRPG